MLKDAKVRARQTGVRLNIDIEYLVEKFQDLEQCPILGIPINWQSVGCAGPDSPSLDRIIPSDGYIQGNVQVISHKANTIKSNCDFLELMTFGEWATQFAIRKIAKFYSND